MRTSSVDLVILEMLGKEHAHLTSHEVYERIRSQLPAVNASTVYRSLERLASAGKISVSDMGTGSEVYESLADGMHHHLVCQSCGKVITIGHEEVKDFFDAIQRKHRFAITTNHLILFGLCEQCRAKETEEKQDV